MNRTELWQSCWSPIHLEIARYSQHSSNLESKCGCVPSCRSQQDMRGTLHSMSLCRRGANENFASLKWCSWRLDHPKYLFWSQHEKVSALAAAFTSDSPWGVAHCSQNHIWDLTKRTKLESNIIVHLGKLQGFVCITQAFNCCSCDLTTKERHCGTKLQRRLCAWPRRAPSTASKSLISFWRPLQCHDALGQWWRAWSCCSIQAVQVGNHRMFSPVSTRRSLTSHAHWCGSSAWAELFT